MGVLRRLFLVWLCWQGQVHALELGEENLWNQISSGDHVVMVRHALAPGGGDPDNFDVNDCSTQRNLSLQGREQAEHMGNLFRQNGIENARIYSSQWCRCLDTAELLGLGQVEQLPPLNSFFQDRAKAVPQTEALLQWLAEQDLNEVIVLVTHQVNITELTGIFPASGEMIVLKREENNALIPVGRIPTHH